MANAKKPHVTKEMVGRVLSDKMHKTIVVNVGRLTAHPVFKKTVKRFNKFKAHDEKNAAKIGDLVRIRQSPPISKDKR
ncbi:MAG: 30S ribosomal protein S17, partial [Omnitrophica bacterium RBG_13_46_9]